ncbi:MAG: LuxR C-terminal-related transcriptional regulator [Acidobacteriota bacterium]|nr:LuxR C-terminal-related transcriptional regulator [Acidobacteriota bacterium]
MGEATVKQIQERLPGAFALNVTPRTVAFHKYTMMEQLHVRSSAELIQYAMKGQRNMSAPTHTRRVHLQTVRVRDLPQRRTLVSQLPAGVLA